MNGNGTDAAAVEETLSQNASSVWVLLNAVNILAMQIGFALLEAGSVRKWHVKSILMKNMLDGAVGAVAWWVCGYAISVGEVKQMVTNDGDHFQSFFISYCFAITTGTIASGAIAGRLKFKVYLILSFATTGLSYATISYWVWGGGFLSDSYVDYAGGVVVHGVGGTIALVASWLVGPRFGRFVRAIDAMSESAPSTASAAAATAIVPIPGSNPVLQAMGSMMLYCSWFSFNAVSAGSASSEDLQLSNRAVINTVIASGFASLCCLLVLHLRTGVFNLALTANSMLAGLVSVTAGCAFLDTWAAALIGAFSAPLYLAADEFVLRKLRIDDPLAASALHGVVGLYGGIMTGIFDNSRGLVSSSPEKWDFLWVQCWGSFAILAFAAAFTMALLFPLHILIKCKSRHDGGDGSGLGHSENDQLLGLDFVYHDADYEKRQDLSRTEVQYFHLRKAALSQAYAEAEKKLRAQRAAARSGRKNKAAKPVNITAQKVNLAAAYSSGRWDPELETQQVSRVPSTRSMNDFCNSSELPPDLDLEAADDHSEQHDDRDLELVDSPGGSTSPSLEEISTNVSCA